MGNVEGTYRRKFTLRAAVAFLLVLVSTVYAPANSTATSNNPSLVQQSATIAVHTASLTSLTDENHELTQVEVSENTESRHSPSHILYLFGQEEITDSQEEQKEEQFRSSQNSIPLLLITKNPVMGISSHLLVNDPNYCFLQTVLLLH